MRGNIGPRGRLVRLAMGVVLLLFAVGAAVWLIRVRLPRPWRLTVFIPLAIGLLDILQAKERC